MYEEIKAEIERRFRDYGTPLHDEEVTKKVDEILSFIESLPKPSEDLEKEIERYCSPLDVWNIRQAPFIHLENCARHFAQWQMEQMIPVTALVNESKDFLSLSLSTEEYAKIGRRFKGGDDIEIYIKQDKK